MCSQCTTEVVESGIDWVTATATDPDRRKLLRSAGEILLSGERLRGGIDKKLGFQGYRTTVAGHAQVGEREDSTIVRVGGWAATDAYPLLAEVCENTTRLDLMVTAKTAEYEPCVALAARGELERPWRRKGRPPAWEYRAFSDGSETLYVGSRSSDWYLRLYNKQLESRNPAYLHCWRWEVETKGGAAARLVADLRLVDHRDRYVQSLVWGAFDRRGVRPHFSGQPIDVGRYALAEVTDTQRSLNWLYKQARPTVERLRDHVAPDTLGRALGYQIQGLLVNRDGTPSDLGELVE